MSKINTLFKDIFTQISYTVHCSELKLETL